MTHRWILCGSGAAAVAAMLVAGTAGSGRAASADRTRNHHALIVHQHHGLRPAIAFAEPLFVGLDPLGGVGFQTPFFAVTAPGRPLAVVRVPHYQGPDGTYDSLADLTNSIQGTPCGEECTAASLARWGYTSVE